jgi:hypothetical protein
VSIPYRWRTAQHKRDDPVPAEMHFVRILRQIRMAASYRNPRVERACWRALMDYLAAKAWVQQQRRLDGFD